LQHRSPQTSAGAQQMALSTHMSVSCGQQTSPQMADPVGPSGQHVPFISPCVMQLWSVLQHSLPSHGCWSPAQQCPVLKFRQVSPLRQHVGVLPNPQVIGQQLDELSQSSIPRAVTTAASAMQTAQPMPKLHQHVPTAHTTPSAVPSAVAAILHQLQEPVS
jgi:hypothetical protein